MGLTSFVDIPTVPRMSIEVRVPAKINLHLRVGSARADGFHPLLTWMVTVGLFDTLRMEPAAVDSFTCSDASLPTDGQNLVVRALHLLRETRDVPPVAIHLDKKIPSGGGLGGGSSDAASVLMAIDRQYPTAGGPDAAKLALMAAKLGSDVPFFLFGPSSICRGRGEVITPIAPPGKAKFAVLFLPDIAVPTAEAYRTFDRLQLGDDRAVSGDVDFANGVDLPAEQLLDKLVNDLEAPAYAIRPELGDLRQSLQSQLKRIVRMSGSGSSLFTLYDSRVAAAKAARTCTAIRAVVVELGVTG